MLKSKRPTNPFFLIKAKAIEDKATGNWKYEFQFLTNPGRRTAIVDGDVANVSAKLEQVLHLKGASLPLDQAARKLMIETAIASKPARVISRVATAGWQIDGSRAPWFTVGHTLIGAPKSTFEYASPAVVDKTLGRVLKKSGTLSEWKKRVAAPAARSSCLMLTISAGLAAPLLRSTAMSNFILFLFGKSQSGKTTGLMACTSLYGIGEEDLQNFFATGLKIQEDAAAFDYLVYPMNELGALKGPPARLSI
jgi:Domain of unknown function (DUF927)